MAWQEGQVTLDYKRMNSTVSKGRLAEYYVKRLLEQQGYTYIIRSYASLTPIDLLASDGKQVVAVQVKQGGYISRGERNNLVEWAGKFKAAPLVARKHSGRWELNMIGKT